MHRLFENPLIRALYGVWVWSVLLTIAALLAPLVLVLPGDHNRRRAARAAARGFLGLTGMPPRAYGLANVPPGPCVVVANHQSYLDGILLTAVLPPRFGFVIKREMTRVPLAHLLLRRVGSMFVDRFDARRGTRDVRRFYRAARRGDCLAFFPEGTFVAEPGVGPFKMGAFQIAARLEIPVLPLAVRGTRFLLPSGSWLPRPGRPEVHVDGPVTPAAGTRDAARVLREVCRERIVALSGEPDLAGAAVWRRHLERLAG